MTGRETIRGYALLIGATLFWGASTVAGRHIMREVSPIVLAQLSATGSWLLLAVYVAVTNPRRLFIAPREIWKFVLLGSMGFAAASTLMNVGINLTNAPTTVVLHYVAPALVLGWGAMRGTESFTAFKLVAVLACITGCALTVGLHEGRLAFHPWGVAAALGAAVVFAWITVFARGFTGRYDPVAFTSHVFFSAAVTLALIPGGLDWSAFGRNPSLVRETILYTVFLAAMPPVLYFAALRVVPSTAAVIICSFEVVVSAAISAVALGESLGPVQMGGAGLILLAIALVEISRLREPKPVVQGIVPPDPAAAG